MTKKNAPYIIIISICVIGILVFGIAYYQDIKSRDSTLMIKQIYFKTAANTIESEEFPIQKHENKKMASLVLGKFLEGPKNLNLHKTMPDELSYLETPEIKNMTDHTGSVFVINFSEEYFNMTPIEEMLFRASLVWTMTDLDFINNVEILVEDKELYNGLGQPMGLQNRINIDIRPVIIATKSVSREVKLYFADETGVKLLPEERRIDVNPDLPLEQFIVDHIIQGPRQKGHFPTVSADIKIRDVTTTEGICIVNLSDDFINKSPSSHVTGEAAVYSIVNSLMELPRVNKVRISIDSDYVVWGDIDLNRQFERNDAIILGITP